MPRPVNTQAAYHPGLDGLRTVAVGLVVAYHLGVPFAGGGLLGVGVFFTLSGFLITSILLRRHDRHGDLDLKEFWIRRFRRLLPAVVILLLAVLAATALVEPDRMGDRAAEALAALLYVANWHTIATGGSYFDPDNGVGPLDHLWSLAVEEQFYLLWPLLLLGLLRLTPGRPRLRAAVTFALGLSSMVLLAVLADPSGDSTRAYEGTDTRAGGLLWGAALAMVWRPDVVARVRGAGVRVLDALGVAGLAGILVLVAVLGDGSPSLYTWGIAALTLAACAALVPLVHPASWVARVLGVAPLRWIGTRSYGIYLWHLPVVAFLPERTLHGHPVARGAVIVALTVALAALSWRLVEDPIRRRGLRAFLAGRPDDAARRAEPVPTAAEARPAPRHAAPAVLPAAVGRPWRSAAATVVVVTTAAASLVGLAHLPQKSVQDIAAEGGRVVSEPVDTRATRTACRTVVHIGDSTSLALGDTDRGLIDDPSQRLRAQYEAVGVERVVEDVVGGRSLREHMGVGGADDTNGPEAMERHAGEIGPDGCWVVALGMNDSATMAKDGDAEMSGAAARIDEVMARAQGRPVLWVAPAIAPWTTRKWYEQENVARFNRELFAAAQRHPDLHVYDWSAQADRNPSWYEEKDANHNSPEGALVKARDTARALKTAFPADAASPESKVFALQ